MFLCLFRCGRFAGVSPFVVAAVRVDVCDVLVVDAVAVVVWWSLIHTVVVSVLWFVAVLQMSSPSLLLFVLVLLYKGL